MQGHNLLRAEPLPLHLQSSPPKTFSHNTWFEKAQSGHPASTRSRFRGQIGTSAPQPPSGCFDHPRDRRLPFAPRVSELRHPVLVRNVRISTGGQHQFRDFSAPRTAVPEQQSFRSGALVSFYIEANDSLSLANSLVGTLCRNENFQAS